MAVLAVSALALSAFTGRAGWIEHTPDKTILHLKVHDWIFPDPFRTDTASRADLAAIRAFMEAFPSIYAERYRDAYKSDPETYGEYNWDNVEVRLHKFSGLKVEGVESDLLAIAGRSAPDILYVNFRKSDTYIQQGFLYPLDRPEDGYMTAMADEELDLRVHPKIWPVIRRTGPGGERHTWALPYGGALGRVLLYRKDLFDEAGIPYPDAEWTWDDLHDACRRIADPGNGIYAIRFGRGKHESWYWINFLWSAGGEVQTYNEETDTWNVVYDTREAAVALDFYTRLCTEPWVDRNGTKRYGYAYKDPSEAYVKWSRGEIAMATGYIDEKLFADINPDITGMAPLPLGPTGMRAGELNSRMMGIYAGMEEPALRDAAWEFIRFYDSKEALAIKTRIMVEGGLGRFVNPRYLRMFGYEELIRLAPRGWEETFHTVIESAKPEPYGRHSNIAYELLTQPLQKAEQMAMAGKLPDDREERLAVLHELLLDSAAKARQEMLGEVPPEEMSKRRIGAAVFLVTVMLVFTLVLRSVARAFTPPDVRRGDKPRLGLRTYATAYLLLLPALLTIALWQYYPLLRGSVMAFQDYRIMGGSSFVWLDNFAQVLWDAYWWQSVWNSIRYSLLVVALTFLPPVVLAILLQEVPRGKILFRTLFYLPAVITGLVVILLWKSFYDPNEQGALNAVIMKIPSAGFLAAGILLLLLCAAFGRRLLYHGIRMPAAAFFAAGAMLCGTLISMVMPVLTQADMPVWQRLLSPIQEPIRWLGDPGTAMIACVIPMVWAGMGPGCLIYLAALKGIADDYYEAADLDGATFIDKILFIVFPILKPLLIINFVGVFVGSWFHATANILAMTGGGANTEVAGLHIFYKAFIFLKFGPATAMAWVLALLLIGFTVYQLRILSRLEFKTTGDER